MHARNVRGILEAVQRLPPSSKAVQSPVKETASPTFLDRLDGVLHAKGIAILVLGQSALPSVAPDPGLVGFFARPLHPPNLRNGYLRIHLDSLDASLSSRASSSPQVQSHPRPQQASSLSSSQFPIVSCTVSDISVLAFHSTPQPMSTSQAIPSHNVSHMFSSPVLITDQHLSASYQTASSNSSSLHHKHPITDEEKSRPLPSFDVLDWTDRSGRTHGASLRHWRTKVAQTGMHHHKKHSGGVGGLGLSVAGLSASPPRSGGQARLSSSPTSPTSISHPGTSPTHRRIAAPSSSVLPALTVRISAREHTFDGSANAGLNVSVRTNALHVFVGLEGVAALVPFLDEAIPSSFTSSGPTSGISDEEESRVYEDLAPSRDEDHLSPQEQERKRLEKLVLDDLDLSLNYLPSKKGKKSTSRPVTMPPTNKDQAKASDVCPCQYFYAYVCSSVTSASRLLRMLQ